MSIHPKISVIMPTYNRAYIIWKAILSVIGQNYPFWELIVIDDGSADCTEKLVKEFNDPRIIYIKQSNRGPAAARNTGLSHASGKYICYLDSDNEFEKLYIGRMLEHIQKKKGTKFAVCNQNVRWELYNDKWNLINYAQESSSFGEVVTRDDLVYRKKRFDGNGLMHVYNRVLKWNERVKYMEDWEFVLQLVNLYPNGFIHVPLALVSYYSRYGRDGACANVSYKAWQDSYREILRSQEKGKYRPDDKWFDEKIKKYDQLIMTKGNDKSVESRIKEIFGVQK